MKGHLDVKQLESYNKADLQELAKQLGVDAEGTKKEIAARCAAVEVDIPDDSELTEEDKKVAAEAAAEAAAKAEEEKAAAEAAAKAEEEKAAAEAAEPAAEAAAKAEEEKAAAEAVAKAEEEKKAAGLVKVKAKRRFLDKELNQIKDTGDIYTVSRERAAVLEEAGVAVVMTE
ncbi:hypothetical protein [Mediterraneibacter gnavus]|uniref:hypothetical protein n=1 Tax=Mediterraneibacter gnavus TaxID=33038 RepID=UPI0022533BB5|nr:hypothetical protein [Mediterraneibacter gnavus]UZT20061.1 hypothetical protein ORL52_10490 [Mediterraneibacter gnavus]